LWIKVLVIKKVCRRGSK